MKLHFVDATLSQNWFFYNLLCGSDRYFCFFGRKYRKNYRKPIYRHFSNYRQNYRYRYKISKFIGDLMELSAKLSISKSTGDLSKSYRYRKKWLIAHPYKHKTERKTLLLSSKNMKTDEKWKKLMFSSCHKHETDWKKLVLVSIHET